MSRGRAAAVLAAVDVVALLIVMVTDREADYAAYVLYVVFVASFAGMGALLISRASENPIGYLLSATGTLIVVIAAIGVYANIAAQETPPLPGADAARSLADAMYIIPVLLAVVRIPLIYPDGRLPSRRYRWVVVLLLAGMAAWIINVLFHTRLDVIVGFSVPISFIGSAFAIVGKFRRGDAMLRAQVKWLAAIVVAAGIALLAGTFTVNDFPDLSNALIIVGMLATLSMPIAIGMAILRYRLYDIDRIVSCTIAYAIVTGILLTALAAAIIVLQTALARVTGGETIAVAASTLAVLAVFQPIMRRVRATVDRRFDRARYDAERMVAAYSQRLRNEVDIERVTTDLARTAAAALAPTTLTIWLRRNETGGRFIPVTIPEHPTATVIAT